MTRCSLILLLLLASNSGCALRALWNTSNSVPLPPPAFGQTDPTLPEVIYAVNANSDRVRQLQTEGAALRIAGFPTGLRADLALDRPRRFRMTAELLQFTGRELDMGSNDNLFWLWVRRNPEPAIFYARHEQFASSAARQLLPVEPYWLIDALGLLQLDASGRHEGPYQRDDGNLEIRSQVLSSQGTLTRVLVVDRQFAWILEQQVYDPGGQILAATRAGQHRFYPLEGVSLPHQVDVQLAPGQPQQLAFQLTVNRYVVNQIYGEPAQLWNIPRIEGVPAVDLADPRLQLAVPVAASQTYQTAERPPSPAYRGYDRRW